MVKSSPDVERDGQEKEAPLATEAADAAAWGRSFMRRLAPGDQLEFASVVRREQYPAGSVIFREGEPGSELYIVWSGRVAIVKEDPGGRPALLAYRGPGEVVGEMGVMSDRPRSASVVAVENCDLLAVHAADFRRLMASHPRIGQVLLEVLSDRLRSADMARMTVLREGEAATRRVGELNREVEQLAALIHQRRELLDLVAQNLWDPLLIIQNSLDLLQAMLPQKALASAAGVLDQARGSTVQILSLAEALLGKARPGESPDAGESVDAIKVLGAASDR